MKPLPKRYNPHEFEDRWAKEWSDHPFVADASSEKPPFCVVIPPPNVTGNLHIGHAFDNTIIDTIARYKRQRGYETLYQPGTDHAGIITQTQVERSLAASGKTRHDLGREAFIDYVWDWRERYGSIILEQLRRLGVSCDWSRTRFTIDDGLSRAVRYQFVRLYHEGLVFRGHRIINWDPAAQTTVSDLEIERQGRPGEIYTIAYPIRDGGSLSVATVRPETIFADSAVAVHPTSNEHRDLVGRMVRIPLTERWIPVIADASVDRDFGTGALKVTPAHDATDFEIGKRHDLPMPSVIGLDARTQGDLVPADFRGLDRFDARVEVVSALQADGALVGRQDYTISVSLSERSGEPIEPLLSTQWFFDDPKITEPVLRGVDRGEIRFYPERYAKVHRDWLENLRPWCISRQIWWGHQIPAWYDEDGNVFVPKLESPDVDPPDDPDLAGITLSQDPDVFDTWFSSNLWPLSTLGWPDEEDDFFGRFYPTSVLVTGYDILFLWVCRMEMAGYHFTGTAPFGDVVLHGLVLDEKGQKMSKSKGNGIDPLDLIATYSADALRFAMACSSTGCQDVRWDERRVEMGAAFANKIWNATRFVQSIPANEGKPTGTDLASRWIRSRLSTTIDEVTGCMDRYELGTAARRVYEFVWSEYCDWYLESAKLYAKDPQSGIAEDLLETLKAVLSLLQPIMPFVTSEILEHIQPSLSYAPWPDTEAFEYDPSAEEEYRVLQEAVGAVRNLKATVGIPWTDVGEVAIHEKGGETLGRNRELFEWLSRAGVVGQPGENTIRQVASGIEIIMTIPHEVDLAEWKRRQMKKIDQAKSRRERISGMLKDQGFLAKAPETVVEDRRRNLSETENEIARLETIIGQISST